MPQIRRYLALLLAACLSTSMMLALTGSAEARGKRAPYQISISASSTSVTLGDEIKVAGKASPNASRLPVTLQVRKRGKWSVVAGRKTSKRGAYVMSLRPDTTGLTTYRVCTAGTTKRPGGCSAILKTAAYQWQNLYDMETVDYDYGIEREDPASINGVNYKKSLVGYESGTHFREYNLSRNCTQFRATGGIADSSDSGAKGNLEILADGNSVYSQNFALGQSSPIALTVKDVLRIRIETSSASDRIRDHIGIGTPQALCR